MSEKENSKNVSEINSWDGVTRLVADAVKENRSLASEAMQGARRESKAKDIAIVCMTILIIAIVAIMSDKYYKNDEQWRNLISEYDFVTQDGEGINYYNSDIVGGYINNGATGYEEEEP